MNQDKLIRHYQSLLSEFGPAAQALQWADADTQQARFEVLSQVADPLGSVLDVGCGLGDFWAYLRRTGWTGRFHGTDIVPEFVEHANAAMAGDDAASASLSTGSLPKGYEWALLSGVFNNAMDDNWGFATTMLRQMWDVAECGIAFNAMTTYVDYRDPGLWYVDPLEMVDFCKNELGGHPILRHDYILRSGGYPFEFAMYVYKNPRSAIA